MRIAFLALLLSGSPVFAQADARKLPFDVSASEFARVDTTRMEWKLVRSYAGGVDAELLYAPPELTADGCRAASVLGMTRVVNTYRRQRGGQPVVLRLSVRCARAYRGNVDYDGLNTKLRITDLATGAVLYSGSEPGLP